MRNNFVAFDVALIRVVRSFIPNSLVQPALLVNPGYVPRFGSRFVLVGWGRTIPVSSGGQSFSLKEVNAHGYTAYVGYNT